MNSLLDTEANRLAEQIRLDSLKTAEERNKCGQFATPPSLSTDIAKYAWKRLRRREGSFRFIDPAIGTGSFFSAVRNVFPADRLSHAAGIELDPGFAKAASVLWGVHGLEVTEGDFTKQPPPAEKYNLLLTNPPYVRHHHLSGADKARLNALLAERLGMSISGLAGLYCYFLLLSDSWLADKALSAWLIPSEFMDVNYGNTVKQYLLEHVTLLHIHRFCPSDVQFADALVSSAVVIFEKAKPKKGHAARFTFGGSLNKPEVTQSVELSELRGVRKWTTLPERNSNGRRLSSITLGDLFDVKRGLATGNNEFFVLPLERAKELEIPTQYLRPIVPSPRYMRESVIEGDRKGYARLDRQLALIDCPLDEDTVRTKHPTFWGYLEQGKAKGVHQGYLASRRVPWYSQEKREPAPFLCTYMGRSKQRPFRFIWNKSRAVAANVYLLLYPKGALKSALEKNPALYETLFAALHEIEAEDFISEGRVYGGGLHKMEPAELKRLPADEIVKVLGLSVQQTFGF